ncbi:MAG: DUF192 domain-containing protein [Gammaproteobacteria bacterium]|nr:DUF192 domain-containing protein [Gammaproteobacteria bacterium]
MDKFLQRSSGPVPTLTLLITLGMVAAPAIASRPIDSPDERLIIQVSENIQHEFRIHLAVSPSERSQGLMYVRKMPDDVGMLFIYERPTLISMWMKNTYIPLDMIFIGEDGRILTIASDTVPHSLATIGSGKPAIGILEINAGISKKLGLAPGQIVRQRVLPSAAKEQASETD